MAYDEALADRIEALLKKQKGFSSKKMFGGICFLINGNMCCGVDKSRVMVRIGAEAYEGALREKGVRPMDFTGRPLKGFLFLTDQSAANPSTFRKWIGRSADFVKTLPRKKPKEK